MRYLMMMLGVMGVWTIFPIGIQSAVGQAPGAWDWVVREDNGCWVPGAGPDRQFCKAFWAPLFDANIVPPACPGNCTTDTEKCDARPDMRYWEIGSDYNETTPSFARVGSGTGNGNLGRVRALKCVERGDCECLDLGNVSKCIRDLDSKTYDSFGLLDGDLGGPACVPPPPSGSTGGGSSGGGSSGVGGGSGGSGP